MRLKVLGRCFTATKTNSGFCRNQVLVTATDEGFVEGFRFCYSCQISFLCFITHPEFAAQLRVGVLTPAVMRGNILIQSALNLKLLRLTTKTTLEPFIASFCDLILFCTICFKADYHKKNGETQKGIGLIQQAQSKI